jgi:WD40 repeat protein
MENHAEQLLSVGADGAVIAWDLVRGDGSEVLRIPGPLSLAAFGASHAVVASAVGSAITVRCLAPCSEEWSLNRLRIRATALAFHDRDSALLIAGSDGRVYRWRFIAEREARTFSEQERTLERYAAHQSVVSAVAAHPFERAFFSGDWNGALFGWLPYTADPHEGRYDRNLFGARFYADKTTFVKALRTPDRGISALALADSGERLVLGTEDGYVEVWEVKGFELTARRLLHNGRVLGVGLDPSGRWVASAGRDGVVAVTTTEADPQYGIAANALRMKLTPILSQPIERASGVRFLGSGNVLVTTGAGSIAEVRDFSRAPPVITATPTAVPKPRDQDYG